MINVLANHGICRQKGKVCIESRGLFVEVSRTHVAVPYNLPFLHTLDEEQLAVHFETGNTEDHLDSSLSESLRPRDICLLIESRRKLHHNTHTFAVVLRVNQRINNL